MLLGTLISTQTALNGKNPLPNEGSKQYMWKINMTYDVSHMSYMDDTCIM